MGKNLNDTLRECKNAATDGKKLAEKNLSALSQIITQIKNGLSETKRQMSCGGVKIPEECSKFLRQAELAKDNLQKSFSGVSKEIRNRNNELSLFTIVVYGRTKAGKSTLMEVLTDGNGQSIGKGSQRTTLDVRKYQWNGLTVFDTPGIDAATSGGRDDEKKAFVAAEKGDLLIFLFSDDAPQQEEAAAFSVLKKIGKPILGLINVKSSSSDDTMTKMRLRDVERKMDEKRLTDIKRQFLQLASNGSGQWDNVEFLYTDLHSAFLSLSKRDGSDAEYIKKLRKLSRIAEVEKKVINEISSKGTFFQYRTFIDIVYRNVWEAENALRQQYLQCLFVTQNLQDGCAELEKICSKIERLGLKRIDAFVREQEGILRNLAADFARENYENEDAGDDWVRAVKRQHIEDLAKECLQDIAGETEIELKKFARNFQQKLSFNQNIQFSSLSGESILDTAFISQIGVAAVGIGMAIVFGAEILAGPVGWFLAGVSLLFGFLFSSKQKKIREAIQKMEEQLFDWIRNFAPKIKEQLEDRFRTNIMEGSVNKVKKQFSQLKDNFQSLTNCYEKFVSKLDSNLMDMNLQLVNAAIRHMGRNLDLPIERVARVPGHAIYIEINKKADFNGILSDLADLLQEDVIVDRPYVSKKKCACDILHLPDTAVLVDDSQKLISIEGDKVTEVSRVENYQGLVAELTEYYVQIVGKLPDVTHADEQLVCAVPVLETQKQEMNDKTFADSSDHSSKEVLSWYDSEADLNNPEIQFDVALHYFRGHDIEQDYAKALMWTNRAAKQNYGLAWAFLGDCYYFGMADMIQDYRKAFECYQNSDKNSCGLGTKYLADCYYFGTGTQKNYKKACEYYEKAANAGISEAMLNAGNAFYVAEGAEKDDKRAFEYYKQGADLDEAGAQNNLGNFYYSGIVVARNYDMAEELYRKARAKGCPEALRNLNNF